MTDVANIVQTDPQVNDSLGNVSSSKRTKNIQEEKEFQEPVIVKRKRGRPRKKAATSVKVESESDSDKYEYNSDDSEDIEDYDIFDDDDDPYDTDGKKRRGKAGLR